MSDLIQETIRYKKVTSRVYDDGEPFCRHEVTEEEVNAIEIPKDATAFVFKRNADKATIHSSDETVLAKLHEFVKKNPNEWRLIDQVKIGEEIVSETFECPRIDKGEE